MPRSRPRHPAKETEQVIAEAEARGWRVVYPMGHWGYLYCANGDCRIRISGSRRATAVTRGASDVR